MKDTGKNLTDMSLSKEERAAERERIARLRSEDLELSITPEPISRRTAEHEGEVKRRMKKNPVATLKYFLRIQKAGGPVMTWNGHSFSSDDIEGFHPFSKALTAKHKAKELRKRFLILHKYKIWVDAKTHFVLPMNRKKLAAMRGGSKSNPAPRTNAQLDAAAKKLEDFSGHPVQHLESAYSRSPQKTGLIIGELDLVGYRARRDGKTERYGHHFKKNSRPLLAVTSDGKQLHIVGGQYEFTEAGIEDR